MKNARKNGLALLVRHAESEHTGADGKVFFAGSRLDTEITKNGEKDTKSLAEDIVKEVGETDIILCSPLKRSRQTAEILSRQIEKLSSSKPTLVEIEELTEADVGKFTKKTSKEVRKKYPVRSKKFYDNHIEDWDFPEGEEYESIASRVEPVLDEIASHIDQGKHVVIVSHGMISRVMLYLIDPKKESYWKESDFLHDYIYKITKNDHELNVERI